MILLPGVTLLVGKTGSEGQIEPEPLPLISHTCHSCPAVLELELVLGLSRLPYLSTTIKRDVLADPELQSQDETEIFVVGCQGMLLLDLGVVGKKSIV